MLELIWTVIISTMLLGMVAIAFKVYQAIGIVWIISGAFALGLIIALTRLANKAIESMNNSTTAGTEATKELSEIKLTMLAVNQERFKTTKAIDNLKEIEHHRYQQIKTLNIRLNYLNSRVGELIFLQGGKANQEVLRGGLEEYFSSVHGERKQSGDEDLTNQE